MHACPTGPIKTLKVPSNADDLKINAIGTWKIFNTRL